MSDTVSRYPAGIDDHLRVPLTPAVAKLSEAECPEDFGLPQAKNENSHPDLHHAENNSIKALERHALVDDSTTSHDHSDPWNVDYSLFAYMEHPNKKKGRQLRVQNTHVFTNNESPTDAMSTYPDTDFDGIHHSVGSNDHLGEYQSVSGYMWHKKHMQDVPDTFFKLLCKLKNEWPSATMPYPGDNLKDIFVGIINKLQWMMDDYNKKINDLRKWTEGEVNRLDKRIDNLENKVNNLENTINNINNRLPNIPGMIAVGNININSKSGHYIATHSGDADADLAFV